MAQIVGVRFKPVGKIYHFNPAGLQIKKNDYVVVETSRGVELGKVVVSEKEISPEHINKPLKDVLRIATDADLKMAEENKKKEPKAFEVCAQKIVDRDLLMKLVDVEYSFDGSRITFFFTADGRIDFRELVKDLAAHFHTRIELRQIGVRDEARMLGGLGICGYPYCCKQFLDDFQPVSIKMAKEQGLSLNPTKISGSCGRLM
ncbi:MAG: stage 0 sporulation family protein, partial [Clostridia bacterium]|nr:stage 0 sporulation family protein [Clostridia bacterium]